MRKVDFRLAPEYGGFASFVDCELVQDDRVATPLRFLWRRYRQHCATWGYPAVDSRTFSTYCANEPLMKLRQFPEARGYIRSVVDGISIKGAANPA